jgi:hypothetical protein
LQVTTLSKKEVPTVNIEDTIDGPRRGKRKRRLAAGKKLAERKAKAAPDSEEESSEEVEEEAPRKKSKKQPKKDTKKQKEQAGNDVLMSKIQEMQSALLKGVRAEMKEDMAQLFSSMKGAHAPRDDDDGREKVSKTKSQNEDPQREGEVERESSNDRQKTILTLIPCLTLPTLRPTRARRKRKKGRAQSFCSSTRCKRLNVCSVDETVLSVRLNAQLFIFVNDVI